MPRKFRVSGTVSLNETVPDTFRIPQFIETSNVVCHPLPILKAVYVNVFSCKAFDTEAAKRFSVEFWRAESVVYTVVTRT